MPKRSAAQSAHMNTLNQKNHTTAHTYGYKGAPRIINPADKTVVKDCAPAVIYQAGGSHYDKLLKLVRQFLPNTIECPSIYVVEKADVSPFGANKLPTKADVLASLVGYHHLKVPYVMLATKQANDELVAAAKKNGSNELAIHEAEYYLLFTTVDACEERVLSLVAANTLGESNELLAAMGEPITSQAAIRADWKLSKKEAKTLPMLWTKARSVFTATTRSLADRGMFSPFLRYTRNPDCHRNKTQVGARVVKGVVQDQQAACSVAVASREIECAIKPTMEGAIAQHIKLLQQNSKGSKVTITVNYFPMNAKAV